MPACAKFALFFLPSNFHKRHLSSFYHTEAKLLNNGEGNGTKKGARLAENKKGINRSVGFSTFFCVLDSRRIFLLPFHGHVTARGRQNTDSPRPLLELGAQGTNLE